MSAENRNGFNLQRCCSFCRRTGHRIRNCTDERFNNFERICINFINENEINEVRFRSFLLDEAIREPQLIKAFAIIKCNLSTRDQIDVCIESIVNYFRSIFTENQEPVNIEEFVTQSEQVIVITTENIRGSGIRDDILFLRFLRYIWQYDYKKFNITTTLNNSDENLEEKYECNICYENCKKIKFIKLNCNHEFCNDCVKKSLQNEINTSLRCAFCRSEVINFEVRDLSIKDELNEFIKV